MALNYLLLLDTDKIKNYIFSSSKLKEIRGASMLLEYLNTAITRQVIAESLEIEETELDTYPEVEIIYLDGGSGKIEFENEIIARKCAQKIEAAYREWTETASISWEIVKINHNNYYQSVAEGEFKLRCKKQSGKVHGQKKHLGIIHRCSHNGMEMVENINQNFHRVPGVEGKFKALSSVNLEKVSTSSVIKQTFYEKQKNSGWMIRSEIEKAYNPSSFEWPKQLSVIGEAAGNGDIGFLYFDGNSMNKVLKSLRTSNEYKEFSSQLRKAIYQSLISTVTSLFQRDLPRLNNSDEEVESKQISEVLPIEFILTAGDDVIVFVPSTMAMEFASRFQKAFSEETRSITHDENGLTMAAGVVIAKATFPIKYLVPLAEQLLKSAKKKNYELTRLDEKVWSKLSTIDYMVVSMSSNPELDSVRKEQLSRDDEKFVLTNRPYTFEQWEVVKNIIQDMKSSSPSFSNSKLKSFYNLHFLDEWEGNYYFQKQFANLSNDQKKNIRSLYEHFADDMFHSHWYEENGKKVSPLIDVIEIYRYVKERESNEVVYH